MLFYKCNRCGNFITFLTEKTAVTPVCCGETMTEILANTTDAAQEKHVPVVTCEGNTVVVKVGSVDHPMLDEHYIQFIILETTKGYQKKDLKPGEAPCASFALAEDEKPVAAYEYCNLHGLWKADCFDSVSVETVNMYECGPCGYVYDKEVGDPDNGIAPGTAFADLPEDWVCPICGAGKEEFKVVE